MAFCHSSLLLTLLLLSSAVKASDEREEFIEIDNDEEVETEIHPRLPRQVREGSGMWPDYNLDDEDTVVPEYGNTHIVSSRIIPEASSPTFSYPSSPRTSRGQTPALNTAHPGRENRGRRQKGERPARPPRLSSYYPDLHHSASEGSGGGDEGGFISSLGHYNDSDLISPTRTHQFPGAGATSLAPPYVSTSPINHEPFINSRLDKVPLTAGKTSR